MKGHILLATLAVGGLISGCGGGGGGGTPGPTPIPLGTFKAGSNRTTAPAAFTSTVNGASASGTTVQIYGDERTGAVNAYDTSHRLTMTLYGPVTAGTYAVGTTHAAGTAYVSYTETAKQGGVYVTTGSWTGNSGSVVVSVTNNTHIEGTFDLNVTNAATGNAIHFSAGQYSVSYETPPPPPS